MYKKSKRSALVVVMALPLLFSAGLANANTVAPQSSLQGADYLTSQPGTPARQSAPHNAYAGNGVAGARVAALSVPEPSSIALFGGALALLGFGCAARARKFSHRDG